MESLFQGYKRSLSCLCLAALLTLFLVWGCASKGFIKKDRFINHGFGFTFQIPEGWIKEDCLPAPVSPLLEASRFPNLHPLVLLSDPVNSGCLEVSAGRSLYSYNFYTKRLFGSQPEKSLRDYSPGLTRSEESAHTATREGHATDPTSIKAQWKAHFRAFQDRTSENDDLDDYRRRRKDFGTHPGFHEEWTVKSEDSLYSVRRKTLFFRCKDDDTCFAAFTLLSPRKNTPENAARLKDMVASFERFMPFERPY